MATTQYTQPKGFAGQQGNMVPATLISRQVESANLPFGAPAFQGADDKGCTTDQTTGSATNGFVGIAIGEFGKGEFAQGDEARLMTQGVVFVTVAEAVVAGGDAYYAADGTWTANGGAGDTKLTGARYDTSGDANDLVELRLGIASA